MVIHQTVRSKNLAVLSELVAEQPEHADVLQDLAAESLLQAAEDSPTEGVEAIARQA